MRYQVLACRGRGGKGHHGSFAGRFWMKSLNDAGQLHPGGGLAVWADGVANGPAKAKSLVGNAVPGVVVEKRVAIRVRL